MIKSRFLIVVALLFGMVQGDFAATNVCSIQIEAPSAPWTNDFAMGTAVNPGGHKLSVDSRSLRLDGQPWLPVMGEFHYSRYPESEWREELLKMKAGGVDIVATYIFWIHHEEVEGKFDWSGRRDLRRFVQLCDEIGLKVLVRCGPWCHGEVRNGALPDWVVAHKDWKLRSTDANFLAKVQILYGQIAAQLKGLLWKDGGPIIAMQVDNEYRGPAAYLIALKKMAREAGMDVPFYTRTGWPKTTTPVPFGELLSCFGSYADGFWERQITPMPGDNWKRFLFSSLRTDTAIGADLLGHREARDEVDTPRYPYLTCEIGGGMMTSYHRRVEVFPADVAALATIHIGSGSSLPGYYLYHGGVNPDGLTTLQESQATGYPNDLPVKTYDFQAPLGEYGQINPQYHLLRRIHLFLHDFGQQLAVMPSTFPAEQITNRMDTNSLRWVVRSDGVGGLVFVNNYARLQPMLPKENVQFDLKLPSGEKIFPSQPVTIPADVSFFWPFNFDLGNGLRLAHATAQPMCVLENDGVRTIFFAQTADVPAEFAFETSQTTITATSGKTSQEDNLTIVRNVKPGRGVALKVMSKSGEKLQIVLLSDVDSLALWKGNWQGSEHVFLTAADLVVDGDGLRLSSEKPEDLMVGIFPAPKAVEVNDKKLSGKVDGIFTRFTPALPKKEIAAAKRTAPEIELIHPAGPVREIPMSKGKSPIVVAPAENDFTNAAVWRIKLPANVDARQNPLLRFHYVGDIARVTLDGKLIDDNFYNGKAFDLGLNRFMPDITQKELLISVLPLRRDAPIYLLKKAWPDFGKDDSVARLSGVEWIPRYEVELQAGK